MLLSYNMHLRLDMQQIRHMIHIAYMYIFLDQKLIKKCYIDKNNT